MGGRWEIERQGGFWIGKEEEGVEGTEGKKH